MQQTENLKLNLIEPADAVDPAPINRNMVTLEGENTALWARLTDMAQNLGSGGKNCRLAWGSYTGNGTCGQSNPNTLNFDFTPVVVLVYSISGLNDVLHLIYPHVRGANSNDYNAASLTVTWGDSSVSWYSSHSTNGVTYQYNYGNHVYGYMALGVDE